MRADRLTGIATSLAGLALAVASRGIEIAPAQPTLSARFLPLLLAAALLCLGLALTFRPGPLRLREAIEPLLARRALLLAGLLLVYFLSFRYVDFRVGAWLFMVLAMLALGARRPLELVVVPPAVALGVYAVFRYGFSVLLPVWI